MHPIEHYETIRRGHEELLKRAEYQRMARKAIVERRMSRIIRQAANWLGMRLVSLGKKFEQFGSYTETRHSHSPYTPSRP